MAIQSTFKNMTICLLAVCFACSAVLATVYAVTLKPIQAAAAEKTVSAIRAVVPSFRGEPVKGSIRYDGKNIGYYALEVTDSTRAYAIESQVTSGFNGVLSIMVGITPEGTISGTSALVCSETPGLGAKCTEEAFYRQFVGFDPSRKVLKVRKDGGDVDAITAATITSRAYCDALTQAIDVFHIINRGGQDNE
ncbi:MAG: RnfABCDGE type electron transport complex subunit G [Bacteroidales bacterium]|nr:RnfABCDGE type electron transport complex subunit G [Bacteroidales bacterium]